MIKNYMFTYIIKAKDNLIRIAKKNLTKFREKNQ